MVRDYVVNIYGQDFECVDMGIWNKKVEVVIRPEDISLIKAERQIYLKQLLILCYLEGSTMKYVV
ncbi:hypothetical protein ACVQ90_01860 [Staphylococcus aureus]